MGETERLAAIDIGTVTTRLLVADVGSDVVSEVRRETDITHLGEGLTATGVLDEAAMGRVLAVVTNYADLIEELGVQQVTAVATSASRDAANGQRFLDMLESAGIRPEIIAGEREARLAFIGATMGLTGTDLLVVDLGGGSTEFVLGDVAGRGESRAETVRAARSIDVGSKRATERFLHSDPPTLVELEEARRWVTGQIAPYFEGIGRTPDTLFAIAGTATSLVAVRDRMEVYDPSRVHGARLSRADLSELVGMLAALPLAQRRDVVGLDPGRAPVIVAGALILECVLGLAGVETAVVSEHDILHGILVDTWRRRNAASGLA